MNLPEVAFVIDIETYDTRPTARVATIGIVAVDLVAGVVLDTMHILLDAQDQPFRTQSDSTMRWWAEQSATAKLAAFGTFTKRLEVAESLASVSEFIRRHASTGRSDERTYGVWGSGASFDLVVLESLFGERGLGVPWIYRQHRDLRTLYELAGVKLSDFVEAGETQHNAVDDAKVEARAMLAALAALGHQFSPPATEQVAAGEVAA